MSTQQKNALIKDRDFQILAELLPDFIAKYDTEGRFTYMNGRLRQALGVDGIGLRPSEAFPDGRFYEYEQKVFACARTGLPDHMDLVVPDFDGNPVEYHNIRFVAERDVHGNIIAVIAFGRDMTKRILLEQQLTASSRMASLGEMAGGIAHEVNNPLAIIYGKIRQMEKVIRKDEIDRERLLQMTSEIEQTVHRISRIIKGLKTFSRDGSSDPFKVEVIQEVLKDALSFCEQRIRHQGIELQTENLGALGPVTIECRSTEISQVLVNLLNNAYDAVLETPEPWIRVELREMGGEVELVVLDNGPGIHPDHQSKIMHPFFTTKPVGKGTGLGLSLSKGIIDSHNGKIYLDTESSHTRFVVRLPKVQRER